MKYLLILITLLAIGCKTDENGNIDVSNDTLPSVEIVSCDFLLNNFWQNNAPDHDIKYQFIEITSIDSSSTINSGLMYGIRYQYDSVGNFQYSCNMEYEYTAVDCQGTIVERFVSLNTANGASNCTQSDFNGYFRQIETGMEWSSDANFTGSAYWEPNDTL